MLILISTFLFGPVIKLSRDILLVNNIFDFEDEGD